LLCARALRESIELFAPNVARIRGLRVRLSRRFVDEMSLWCKSQAFTKRVGYDLSAFRGIARAREERKKEERKIKKEKIKEEVYDAY